MGFDFGFTTWVDYPSTPSTPGASDLNRLQNNWKALNTAWTQDSGVTWAAASSSPSLGNGTLECRYLRAGTILHLHMVLVLGTTSNTGSGQWSFTLPSACTAGSGDSWAGLLNCRVRQASGGEYWLGLAEIDGGSAKVTPFTLGPSYPNTHMAYCDATHPISWQSGDSLIIAGTYEGAPQ